MGDAYDDLHDLWTSPAAPGCSWHPTAAEVGEYWLGATPDARRHVARRGGVGSAYDAAVESMRRRYQIAQTLERRALRDAEIIRVGWEVVGPMVEWTAPEGRADMITCLRVGA